VGLDPARGGGETGVAQSTANNVAFRKYCIHVSNVAQRGSSMQKTAHAAM